MGILYPIQNLILWSLEEISETKVSMIAGSSISSNLLLLGSKSNAIQSSLLLECITLPLYAPLELLEA